MKGGENMNSWILQWHFPGDGGNDVSMIQAADCGIGIEGKVILFVFSLIIATILY